MKIPQPKEYARDQVTKNEIYGELVKAGISKGYTVIPEFRVFLNNGDRHKDIDLVWATRKPLIEPTLIVDNLDIWHIHAAFEIDACDVRAHIQGKEFNRHLADLPEIMNRNPSTPIHLFVVLYTDAYDRNWNRSRNITLDIQQRRDWAKEKKNSVKIIDGRDLNVILTL